MVIKTNNNKEIKITEKDLIVKDGKLFNKTKGFYEALDGDRISFVSSLLGGYKVSTAGTVDGYTYNGHIKLRGAVKDYNTQDGYTAIEHMTRIVDFTDENAVIAEIVYAE